MIITFSNTAVKDPLGAAFSVYKPTTMQLDMLILVTYPHVGSLLDGVLSVIKGKH